MVDRNWGSGRGIDAAPAADDASFRDTDRDTESHDTPVPRRVPAAPSSAGGLGRRRGDLFPIEDSNSDGETRKLPGYSPEQLLAASLDGLPLGGAQSAEPELELAESSWPDDLALEGHPALVDDDEDVVTQAAPLRSQPAPMSRLALPVLGPEPPSRAPAPASAAARSEPPGERAPEQAAASRPPSSAVASSPTSSGLAPLSAAGGAPPPDPGRDDPPPPTGPSRASQAVVFTLMTVLGGALALLIVPDPRSRRPSQTSEPPAESPAILSARPAPDPPPAEQAAPSSTASAAPAAAPASASAAAPSAPTDETPADQAAREALTRLREGIGACVRDKIGTLPGSSPAVPRTISLTRAPGYNALLPEWHTALWSCAGFQWTEPMRFQIQWQVQKRNVEGIGVAWVDHDGDGVPDRVLSFHATMGAGKGEIELGPIEPADPAPAVLPVY